MTATSTTLRSIWSLVYFRMFALQHQYFHYQIYTGLKNLSLQLSATVRLKKKAPILNDP
jgi:hypothetical protein